MLKKKLRPIIITLFVLLIIFAAFVLLFDSIMRNSSVQGLLLGQLSKATGYELQTTKIAYGFTGGLEISLYDLKAVSRSSSQRFEASRLSVNLDMKELIRGHIEVSKIYLFRPQIELGQEGDVRPSKVGQGRISKNILPASLTKCRLLSAKQATIYIKDRPFGLEDLDFELYPKSRDPISLQVNMQGKGVFKKGHMPFTLEGTIAVDESSNNDLSAEMALKTDKFPLNILPWPAFLPVSAGSGKADIKLKGGLMGPMFAEGKVTTENVHFSVVVRERKKEYSIDRLLIDFASFYSEKSLDISSVHMSGPDFSLSGSSKLVFKDASNPYIALKVESPFVPLATFKKIFPTSILRPWLENRIFPALSGGEAGLNLLTLNGTKDQIKNLRLVENADVISLKIALKDIDVLRDRGGLPFTGVSGGVRIEGGGLLVSVEEGGFGTSVINNASFHIGSLYEKHIYRVSLDGLFDLHDLEQQMESDLIPEDIYQRIKRYDRLAGLLRVSLAFDHETARDHTRIIQGDFKCRDCSISHEVLVSPMPLDDVDIEIIGKEIFVKSLKIPLNRGLFDIQGHLQVHNGLMGEISVNTDYLDFSDLQVFRTSGMSHKENDCNIQIVLNARKGGWKRLKYGPLQARCAFRSGDFFIDQAVFRMEHGVLNLNGHLKSEEGPERIYLVSDIELKEQPVSDLLLSIGLEQVACEGDLTGRGKLSVKGSENKDLIPELDGSIDISMGKGRLTKAPAFFKVLDFLSLQNIFKRRLPDLTKEGMFFESIKAGCIIEQGNLKIDNFTMKSPIINATVLGSLDLKDDKIDVLIWAQVYETIDTIISKVPIIGYILTDKEAATKGIIIYPIEVKGNRLDPKIRFVPSLKQVGNGIFQMIKRLFLSPGDLFRDIVKITQFSASKEGVSLPEEALLFDASMDHE